MYKSGVLLPTLFALTSRSRSQEAITQPGLKALIDSLYRVNQQVQEDMITAAQNSVPFDSIKVLEKVEKQTFARHIPLLNGVYGQYGYPVPSTVRQESSSRVFTLVQHPDADVDFQSQMLPLIKKHVARKEASGKDYALLYDRVHLSKGGE